MRRKQANVFTVLVQISPETRQQLLADGVNFFNDGVFPHDGFSFNRSDFPATPALSRYVGVQSRAVNTSQDKYLLKPAEFAGANLATRNAENSTRGADDLAAELCGFAQPGDLG